MEEAVMASSFFAKITRHIMELKAYLEEQAI